MLHTLQARTGASSRDMCQSEMDIIKKKKPNHLDASQNMAFILKLS